MTEPQRFSGRAFPLRNQETEGWSAPLLGALMCVRSTLDCARGHRPTRRCAGAWAAGLLALASLSGCRSTPAYRTTAAQFFVEATDGRGVTLTLPQSEVRIAVNPQPVLTPADIIAVEIAQVELGRCLAFQLSREATRDCYRLTASHQGRRLVLVVNGQPLGARRIDAPIADGVVLVFAELPESALPPLVADMKQTIVAVQREVGRR